MNQIRKGIIYIVLSAFFFASMNVLVRLSGDLPSMQKSFFRNLIAMIFSFIILLKEKHDFTYHKKDIPLLLLRSGFGTIGVLGNYYAVDHLLVSDASMLGKLAPFFVIIFSSLLLKEKASLIQKISIVIAFIGSLFVIKPSIDFMSNMNSIVAIIGALGAGIAYTCVRQLGKHGVPGPKVVFFFSAFSSIILLPVILFDYHPMTLAQLGLLIGAGFMAAGGQFCVTAAYMYAPGKDISVYDYTQVLFAAILGFFFLNQIPDLYSILGYIIIIGIAIFSFLYQRKNLETV